jgi:hypothetical protein
MLNPHLQEGTAKPNGGGASEVSVDGRTWRCRAGVTGYRGRFRPQNSYLVLLRNRRKAILPPKAHQPAVYPGNIGL